MKQIIWKHVKPANLINSTGDETRQVPAAIEDLWECTGAGCGCLDGGEGHLADAVAVSKTKDASGLVEGDGLPDAAHGTIEGGRLPGNNSQRLTTPTLSIGHGYVII